jgi:diaminopimelate epimerase
MGVPRHDPAEIPLAMEREALRYVAEVQGETWEFGAVSVGNPHAVLRVEDVRLAPVTTLGPRLESHALFPQRANIGFMEVIDRHHIRLRVFERGSGETLACGSGACAASVVGIEQGALDSPVKVDLPGGSLEVDWQGRGHPVQLRGPAITVFQGEITL